ncbi:MAG: hypothetical protein MUF82_05380, partial [Bacteroidetes bacterium]|nr:hypothetical protein [Bacteroidota bacterium]
MAEILLSETEIAYGGDVLTQFYYWKGYLAENIRKGIIPYWNPYLFSGTPFLAHPAVAFFYPFTILFILFPLNISFSYIYLLHLIIAGIGLYKLSGIYSDKISSTVSSLVFIFSGYFSARIYAGHIDLYTTAVWIPWIIYFTVSIYNRPGKRKYLGFIVVLSLLILAGYSAYILFSSLFIMFFSFYRIIIAKKDSFIRFFKLMICFFI